MTDAVLGAADSLKHQGKQKDGQMWDEIDD